MLTAPIRTLLLVSILMSGIFGQSWAQAIMINKGATIGITSGAIMIVKTRDFENNQSGYVENSGQLTLEGSMRNENGHIKNSGQIIVERNILNNDSLEGMNAGEFLLKGDWINNSWFEAGQSEVIFEGGDQAIRGTSVSNFFDLTLQGTGVKTQRIDAVVENNLNLNDRELFTDVSKMIVTNASSNAISRTTGFVASEGNGRLVRSMNSSNDYLFPVGGSFLGIVTYRPVVISPENTINQTFEIRMANQDATNEGFDRNDKVNEICDLNPRFFHLIERTNGSRLADIEIFYDIVEDGQWTGISQWGNPTWEIRATAIANTGSPLNSLKISNAGATVIGTGSVAYDLALSTPELDINQAIVTDLSCFESNDGSIWVPETPLNGAPPFTYNWIGFNTDSNFIDGLPSDSIFLQVSDSFNCSETYGFFIDQPDSITINSVITSASCKGIADGCIKLSPIGNFPPFDFNWLITNADTNMVCGLSAGNYSLTITDSLGCDQQELFIVDEPDLLVPEVTPINTTCEDKNDGSASASAIGGTPNYTFVWFDNTIGPDIDSLAAGSYNVTVTDANGCVGTTDFFIDEPSLMALATASHITCNGFDDGIATASAVGGVPPYSYLWEDTVSQAIHDSLSPGIHTVVVSDDNDCPDTTDVEIFEPDPLIVTADEDQITAAGVTAIISVLGTTGGTGISTFLWSPDENVANPTAESTTAIQESTTEYIVTATDENGCIAYDTLIVFVDEKLFPDAFVPVPGATNLLFKPIGTVVLDFLELKIFNRWGQLVYNEKGANIGWDGTFDGSPQPMDTYVYNAVMTFPDGTERKEIGDLILIR